MSCMDCFLKSWGMIGPLLGPRPSRSRLPMFCNLPLVRRTGNSMPTEFSAPTELETSCHHIQETWERWRTPLPVCLRRSIVRKHDAHMFTVHCSGFAESKSKVSTASGNTRLSFDVTSTLHSHSIICHRCSLAILQTCLACKTVVLLSLSANTYTERNRGLPYE